MQLVLFLKNLINLEQFSVIITIIIVIIIIIVSNSFNLQGIIYFKNYLFDTLIIIF